MTLKNFTLISPNYAPEDTAIGLYNTQLGDFLVDNDYKVSVITAFPYYPAWEILNAYLNKPTFYHEKRASLCDPKNPINVYRYRQYVPQKPTFLKRILHLCDFTIGSFLNIFKVKKVDIVFAVIPFTTTALLGLLLAKIKGAYLWVHIQDFEFDAAQNVGIARNRLNFLFKILFKIEKYLLSKADMVSSISYAMCQKITDKTGRNDTYYFPNWIDDTDVNPDTAKQHEFIDNHKGKFTVLYAGNIGEKQDWDIFIQTVRSLRYQTNIHFIVVGDGAYKNTLIDMAQELKNITFYSPVAFNDLGDLLCSCDMHILCQKNDVIDAVMPSKILGMFASARASLVTGNQKSEVAILLKKANAGYFIHTNHIDDIVQAILECAENTQKASEFGSNARQYIIENFLKQAILRKFNKKLSEVIE